MERKITFNHLTRLILSCVELWKSHYSKLSSLSITLNMYLQNAHTLVQRKLKAMTSNYFDMNY